MLQIDKALDDYMTLCQSRGLIAAKGFQIMDGLEFKLTR